MRSTRFRLHVGIEGKTGRRVGKGRKGWREKECWVGSDAFSAGAIPFPSGQLSTGAREHLFTASITLNYSTIHTPSHLPLGGCDIVVSYSSTFWIIALLQRPSVRGLEQCVHLLLFELR